MRRNTPAVQMAPASGTWHPRQARSRDGPANPRPTARRKVWMRATRRDRRQRLSTRQHHTPNRFPRILPERGKTRESEPRCRSHRARRLTGALHARGCLPSPEGSTSEPPRLRVERDVLDPDGAKPELRITGPAHRDGMWCETPENISAMYCLQRVPAMLIQS